MKNGTLCAVYCEVPWLSLCHSMYEVDNILRFTLKKLSYGIGPVGTCKTVWICWEIATKVVLHYVFLIYLNFQSDFQIRWMDAWIDRQMSFIYTNYFTVINFVSKNDLRAIKHRVTLTDIWRGLLATQVKHTLSPLFTLMLNSSLLEMFFPLASLPLYHMILGGGFPSTGHVKFFTPPPVTMVKLGLPINSTGSWKN